MRISYSLFLSFISLISFAQTETLEAITPNGEVRTLNFPVIPNLKHTLKKQNPFPHILISKSELVKVNELLKDNFEEIIKEQNTLYQYRVLQNASNNERTYGPDFNSGGGMSGFRKNVDDVNLMPHILEKKLQLTFEDYFPNNFCYAYNVGRNTNTTLDTLAKTFMVDFLISPQILVIDTIGKQVVSSLQFDVWFKESDSIISTRNFSSVGSNVRSSLDGLIAKTTQYLSSLVLQQRKSGAYIRQNRADAELAKALLQKGLSNPAKNKITSGVELSNLLGLLVNEQDDKALFLDFKTYNPDFGDKLADVFYRNPYPDIEVAGFKDSAPINYQYNIYTAYKYNEIWYPLLFVQSFSHADNQQIAELQSYRKLEESLSFTFDKSELREDFWTTGAAFNNVDTNSFTAEFDTLNSKNWKVRLAVRKNNYGPYQGVSTILADYLTFQNKYYTSRVLEDSITATLLNPLFKKLSRSRVYEFRNVEQIRGSFDMLFNTEMTKAIIPVIVEEPWAQKYLRFFYWDTRWPNELREWIYFEKHLMQAGERKNLVISEYYNRLFPFNFFLKSNHDKSFWEDYVLKQENEVYTFLTLLQVPE